MRLDRYFKKGNFTLHSLVWQKLLPKATHKRGTTLELQTLLTLIIHIQNLIYAVTLFDLYIIYSDVFLSSKTVTSYVRQDKLNVTYSISHSVNEFYFSI